MTDESAFAALRSNSPLVVVEAPAGCGKTHQGADYAREIAASKTHRLLILTHTHAACSVFAERTKFGGSRIEIRTIDSLIVQIAAAYHAGIKLPDDVALWARQNRHGYSQVALKVVNLLKRHPMIAASLAKRYPVVICDEHQDCTGDQHALSMALLSQGARLRIFGDPMQRINREKPLRGSSPACDWIALTKQATMFEQLDTPHRWKADNPNLGDWVLQSRNALKSGGKVNLRTALPTSVKVVFAENRAQGRFDYQLSAMDRRPIDAFEKEQASLLVLTHYSNTARSLRAFFNRRLPLWEGHVRSALENLADAVRTSDGNSTTLAAATVAFIKETGKGFSSSAFGDRFEKEVREGCSTKSRGKPAVIQELAKHLLAQPNHKGIANVLRHLLELKAADKSFSSIEIDFYNEYWDAIRLGEFDDVDSGLAEITHRRTYSRPKPRDKAISTVHKAKGLECAAVILMPCDAKTFPDNYEARCLLYVALSRAKERLLLVTSRENPSPLLDI